MAEDEANGLRTRIAVLESKMEDVLKALEKVQDYPTVRARVNLIALGLKGVVGIIAAAAVKFFFFSS